MRVLSIDGGGIRGLIPALVLTEIEKRSGKQVWELFDLIAGTSTGGILACALCAPDPLPAEQLVALYEEEGPRIFKTSIWQRIHSVEGLVDEKYDSVALDGALDRFLSAKRLSETRPDLLVTSYDMGEPGPLLLQEPQGAREGRGLRALRRRTRDLGRADLLRGVAAAGQGAGRRRRVRQQPGDVRARGGGALPPGGRDRAALARHRPAHPTARLRGDRRLGAAQVGTPDPRRGLRRGVGRRQLPARAHARPRALLAAPGRAHERQRRPRRRQRGQPAPAARARAAADPRQVERDRRRDRRAHLPQGPVSTGPRARSSASATTASGTP